MIFNVITNLTNGVGLQKDYELLKQELETRGHTVHPVQFNAPKHLRHADINVFLEVVTPSVFRFANQQWVVPNPEWWFSGWFDHRWDRILAKTHDCERIYREHYGKKVPVTYIGWTAIDRYDPTIPREDTFLHVAGKSHFKNTQAVMGACSMGGVSLTLISEHIGHQRKRVSDAEISQMMNSHRFHIMPSAYEGYGHVLHEALGCGQIIITTDAPPMNELKPCVKVPSVGHKPHHSGLLHVVRPREVLEAVLKVLQLSADQQQQWAEAARGMYLKEEQEFRQRLTDVLEAV